MFKLRPETHKTSAQCHLWPADHLAVCGDRPWRQQHLCSTSSALALVTMARPEIWDEWKSFILFMNRKVNRNEEPLFDDAQATLQGPQWYTYLCTKNNKQLEQTNKQKNSRIRKGWWGKGTYSYARPGCRDISGFLSIYCLLPGMSLLCLFVTTEDLKNFFLKPHYSAQIMQFHLTFKFQ